MTAKEKPRPEILPEDASFEMIESWSAPLATGGELEPASPRPPPRRRGGPGKWFIGSAVLLVGGLIVSDVVLSLSLLFEHSPVLAASLSAVAVAATGSALLWAVGEARQLARLRSVAALRDEAEDIIRRNGYDLALPFIEKLRRESRPALSAPGLAELERKARHVQSDRGLLLLLDRELLLPSDDEAYRAVARAARDCAVAVAASPIVVFDVAVILWRSLRMMREIAGAYGYRPGIAALSFLLRRALTGAAYAGLVNVAGDLWVQHLGGKLAGYASARLGEGVLVGIRVARLGLLTMQSCRPLPFQKEHEPRLSRLRRDILDSGPAQSAG